MLHDHQGDDRGQRILRNQNAISAERESVLTEKQAVLDRVFVRLKKHERDSENYAAQLNLVSNRLIRVEDKLQRQSANAFALDEFRKLALAELENIPSAAQSDLLNKEKHSEFLDKEWKKFMETKNVKRGIPRLGVDKP